MKMVPHQDKGKNRYVESLSRDFQELQKLLSVPFAGENSLSRIAAPKKMIDGIFKLQPQRTRHSPSWTTKAEMSNV